MPFEIGSKIKVHPLQFFRFLRPFIFILVLPTLRQGVQFVLTGQYDKFLPAEFVLTLWAISTAFFRTRNFYLKYENNTLQIGQGVLFEKISYIKEKGINYISVNISPIDKIFGTKTVKIKTSLSPLPHADLTLTLWERDAEKISNLLGIK